MSTENQRLDNAELVVSIKNIETQILSKFEDVSKAYERANGELKTLGDVSNETKGKIDHLTKEYNALYNRLQEVEQKSATRVETAGSYDLGGDLLKSAEFKDFSEGRTSRLRFEVKTAIINATGQNQPLVPSDRLGGIVTTPNRILSIRDVIPSSATSSSLVEFTRENTFTNNAGPTVSGSPQQFENVTKPESAITFTLVNVPVVTLAHFIPVSKQVMEDSASLAGHVNGRLMYGLKLKEETQLLSGTGANHQLNGLITQATAFTQTSPLTTNEIDIIRMAIKQAHVAEYRPDFLVLNPTDWFSIEIRKVGTSDDRYVVGNPTGGLMGPNIWGLPVIVTNSITAGTFLMGSSMACEIKDRQQAAVEMSYEDSTNFQKNMITVRAEERLALCVWRTEAFLTGSL